MGEQRNGEVKTVLEALGEYRYVILGLSHHTQRWYMTRLSRFVYWCEEQQLLVSDIKPQHLTMYIDERRSQISEATGQSLSTYTLNGHARLIRTFLYWCADEPQRYLSEAIPHHLRMPKIQVKIIEPFTSEQIEALYAAVIRNQYPVVIARDKAILAVLLDTGIRAGELCSLTLEHVHITSEEAYLVVIGKSHKERQVPLGKHSSYLLMDYIRNYRPADCGTKIVFWSHRHEPLTPNGLSQMFCRWEALANITGVRCSAHTCRHSYALNFMLQGGDLLVLSRLLGHTSIKTTEIYLRAFQSIQARKLAKSVLDSLFTEEASDEAYLAEIESASLKGRETTQEEYAQWTAFFCAWHSRLGDTWKRTLHVQEALFDILPVALQLRTGEHPQAFLLRLGAALRKRSGVWYGDERFSVRSRPGPRGMNVWQVYQVSLPEQQKVE